MSTLLSTAQAPGEARVVVTNVSWEKYEAFLALLDEHPGVRTYYLKGELEIVTTSPAHERAKSMIGRVIEHYTFIRQIDLRAYGSTTFREEAAERGAEPDECYVMGRELGKAPDFLIEVVISHGGLDKLAIYAGLGVPEVWFWEKGKIAIHRLGENGYERAKRSAYLPDLDIAVIERYATREDQLAAVTEFDREIRAGGTPEAEPAS